MQSFAERYADFIGVWKDGPTDLAENHDPTLRVRGNGRREQGFSGCVLAVLDQRDEHHKWVVA
jgi:hypothetical protein